MPPTATEAPKPLPVEPSSPDNGTNPSSDERILGYRVHQAAMLLPDPTPEQFELLRADIEKNGILEAVVLCGTCEAMIRRVEDEDLILDGRTRMRIWELLGRDRQDLPTNFLNLVDEDPVAFVISKNAARRHLTPAQIAAVYIQANEMKLKVQKQKAAERQLAGKAPKVTDDLRSGTVAAQVAEDTGVGVGTVKKVLRIAKVAPEKLQEIAKGTTTPNKVLKAVAPKRDPRCAHGSPRANCDQGCCKHGLLRHRCPECRDKTHTEPTTESRKPLKKSKSKTQIRRDEIEARKVEKQVESLCAVIEAVDFERTDDGISERVAGMVEHYRKTLLLYPDAVGPLAIAELKSATNRLADRLEVYRRFLAAVEKIEAA